MVALAGHPILSTSCMRYAREYVTLRDQLAEVGELRLIMITMAKTWERYGIHALEAVYPLLPPGGWQSVANTGSGDANVVHARHEAGVDVVLGVVKDLFGGFGHMLVSGTKATRYAAFGDTFFAFKRQLEVFIEYLRTGQPPFDFAQTVELMKIIIAGLRSREAGGRTVPLDEIELQET
jgi:hypothetical protein